MNQERARQIANYIDKRITLPRQTSPYGPEFNRFDWSAYGGIQRPSAEELASELIRDAEFRALQLGHWLGTTDGEVVAAAVEMVSPPFFRQDIQLLVESLKLAARMQQREGERVAGKVALGAILVAGVVAFTYRGGGSVAKG